MKKYVLIAALAFALALTACGNGENYGNSPDMPDYPGEVSAANVAPPAETPAEPTEPAPEPDDAIIAEAPAENTSTANTSDERVQYSPFIIPVTNLDDLLNLENGFVYFGRPTCPGCVRFMPQLIAAVEASEISVYYFNNDDWREDPRFMDILGAFNVTGVPNLTIVENGEPRRIITNDEAEVPWESYFGL